MTLNEIEKCIVESVKNMLDNDTKLGLSIHTDEKTKDSERGTEHIHNTINDMFAVKTASFTYADAIRSAFTKVHSYKYVDDPGFKTALKKEFTAMGIPKDECEKALDTVDKVQTELNDDNYHEKDYGFNPNMDEINDVSQPEVDMDFNIEDDDGLNDQNVKSKPGNASPGHAGESE